MRGLGSVSTASDPNIRRYRSVSNRLGVALLIFLTLFWGLDWVAELFCDWIVPRLHEPYVTVVRELSDSAAYMLSFMLPVLFFRMITPRADRAPLMLKPQLPRKLYLIIPAGIAIVEAAAIFNAFLMRQLGLAEISQTPLWTNGVSLYEGLLLYIGSVLVPAFCEELLFRGTVLSALLPYGKTGAVLGSALLFGLMHQNPGQLFYATAAGVLLAMIVLKSGSIWVAVLLHMFNNLFSVMEYIVYRRFHLDLATQVISVLEAVVIGGGLICLIVLIVQGSKRQGGLEQVQDEDEAFPLVTEQAQGQTARAFFSPMMTAFVVVCVAQMLLIMIYGYLF